MYIWTEMTLPKGYPRKGMTCRDDSTAKHTINALTNVKKGPLIVSRIRPITTFVVIPIIVALIMIYLGSPLVNTGRSNFNPQEPARSFNDMLILFMSQWSLLISILLSSVLLQILYEDKLGNILKRILKLLTNGAALVDEKFFVDWGQENAIVELAYIERIAYIGVPTIILLFVISYIGYSNPSFLNSNFKHFFENGVLRDVAFILGAFFLVPLLLFFIFILSRTFRFYFAKASIFVAQNKANKLDKIRYFMLGVRAYNKFLTRNLNIRLDEPKIYSKILSSETIDYNAIVSSFDDNDKLKPVACFTNFTDKGDLILQVRSRELIKEIIQFILPILPIVFTILGTLLPNYFGVLKGG